MKASTALKLMIPGYRSRWKRRAACLLDHLSTHAPRMSFGYEGDIPWLAHDQYALTFYGFENDPKTVELFRLIAPYIPAAIPKTHFRLVKDFINRYLYPHMRPDLNVTGYATDQMTGFHGQHKDTIQSFPDEQCRRLMEAFKPGAEDVVIDCGSFIGFGDMHMAQSSPKGRIVAIEASRPCFELLDKNIAANAMDNVTVLHRAVWNESVEIELQSDFAQANTLVDEVHKGTHVQKVQAITIDDVVEDLALPRVDMISLTLNGAELEGLEGARQTLQRHKPRIRLAGWYRRDGEKVAGLAQEMLLAMDYEVFVGVNENVLALPR